MKWEYKRVLFPAGETVGPHSRKSEKRYSKDGKLVNPDAGDSIEDHFNKLGAEGWELITAVNLDSGADSGRAPVLDTIEYIFRRQV